MTEAVLEKRLQAVEQAVADLQRRLDKAQPASNWIDRISGSFENDPEFDEILRLGREFRQAQRLPDDF